MRRVTLLTDFGTADGYVAAMKGVLATRAPGALLEDMGHELPRGNVHHAAWTFGRFWQRFPPGTVHLVVVDPGVGTDRAAMAVEAAGILAVGPDNGVFTPIFRSGHPWRAARLPIPDDASMSFHGRDVFAPAAAELAAGAALDSLGPRLDEPVMLPEPDSPPGEGTVQVVDRFGNLITDIDGAALADAEEVEIGGRRVAVAATYGAVAPGSLLALVGSDGTVEVAARDASAAAVLKVGVGAPVRIA
jgi:S-adenosylmethionine hydrolase